MPAHTVIVDRVVRTGKRAPKIDPRTLRLASYLIPEALPTPPSGVKVPAVPDWPMYGNDVYGDCTIASAGHMIQAWTTDAGRARTPSLQAILNAYWATGDPPGAGVDDNGRYELDVLDYWRKVGIAGRRISAYVSLGGEYEPDGVTLRPINRTYVKLGVYLFGGVYLGIDLPKTAQTQTLWRLDLTKGDDAEPGSWGGHAVPAIAYDRGGVFIVTWGKVVKMTWPFFRYYTDEAFVVLSPELLNTTGRSPEGFDLTALTADLHQIDT